MKKSMNFFIVASLVSVMLMTTVFTANLKEVQSQEEIISDEDDYLKQKALDQELYDSYMEIQESSEGFAKIGELDVDFGNAYRLSRSGNILFASGLTGGSTFVDISDPENPEILGNYWNGGTVYDTLYYKGYCYVATLENGLEILDVDDFDNIQSLATYYDGGEAHDMEFIGLNTMYVADGTGGLEIFTFYTSRVNFTLSKVVTAASLGVTEVLSVQADPLRNIVFLMCGTDGVVVMDTTRLSTPIHIKTLKDGPTDSRDCDLGALMVYIADGANGLKAYNYTDQGNITLVGQFEIEVDEYANYFRWDVANKGFLSTGKSLYLLNITNRTDITMRWKTSFSQGYTYDIAIDSKTVAIANDYDLQILNLSDPDIPLIYSSIIFAGEPNAIAVSNDHKLGILTEGMTGIILINLTDLIEPVLLSKFLKEGTSFYDAEFNNTLVYCATSDGLEILDITDVFNPVIIGSYATSKSLALSFADNVVYLTTREDGLLTIDVTNPAAPVLLDSLSFVDGIFDLSINDNHAFLTFGTSGFTIVDITNPAAISEVDTYAVDDGADGIHVNDTILAVADLTSGIRVYDITNINSLTLLDTAMESGYNVTKVFIEGESIYVAAQEDGLFEIDATDPSNLGGIDKHFNDGGSSLNVLVIDDIVYLTDEVDSFEIIGKDDDLDRLSNYLEENYWLTDPDVADTDLDGLLDGDEVDYWIGRGVDPLSDFEGDTIVNLLDYDSDDDTISDGDEINIYGSDPIDYDSDDDGLLDKDEVDELLGYGTHPAIVDTDNDGVDDYLEIIGFDADALYDGNPGANETGWMPGQIDGGLNATNPDTDYDTPIDGWELTYGFNPLVADSHFDNDTDGLNATMEYLYGSDPHNNDTDGDGLLDGDEVNIHGTSPTLSDTDGDLIDDAFELANGLDPLDDADGREDRDGDGLTNFEEYYWGTDLDDNDTDGDTLPDKWEVYQGTDPNFDDANDDNDNDGLTNIEEYNLGTSPSDPDTDNDGWTDFEEVEEGTDPLDPNDHGERTSYTPSAGFGLLAILALFGLAGFSFAFIRKRK